MKTLLIIAAALLTLPVQAAPSLVLCSYECTEREEYRIADPTWQRIRELFQPAATSAAEERKKLAGAMALMERDIMRRMASEYSEDDFAGELKESFTNEDETRNSSAFIALLMDQGLVQLHVLRRSEKRRAVFGPSQSTAVIQSISESQLYAVDATSTGFGEAPLLEPLTTWKNGTPIKKLSNRIRTLISPDDDSREPEHGNE